METGLTVVPIAVRGTRSMPLDVSWSPRRGNVCITICPPVAPDPTGSPWDKTVTLRDRVRAAILEHCGGPVAESSGGSLADKWRLRVFESDARRFR